MQKMIYVEQARLFIQITEGTGDNLLDEDIAEGYVDYINIDLWEWDGEEFIDLEEGGMFMYKEMVADIPEEQIIKDAISDVLIPGDYNYIIIKERY